MDNSGLRVQRPVTPRNDAGTGKKRAAFSKPCTTQHDLRRRLENATRDSTEERTMDLCIIRGSADSAYFQLFDCSRSEGTRARCLENSILELL